ncbi:MAG: desulfoferrodoxin family protein [Prevotellaceae bacterium]|nr:desulfoferrodoxin family protein [Prevotellaceae bacterium]
MKIQFYHCPICGNVVMKFVDSGIVPVCCEEEMELLEANTTDGKSEYHVPVVSIADKHCVKVDVGKEPHPMSKEHHIRFILLETKDKLGKCGFMVKWLEDDEKPELFFRIKPKAITAVYAYCNIHGLWMTKIKACDTDKMLDDKAKAEAEKCGIYPAFCGEKPNDPKEAYYSCD